MTVTTNAMRRGKIPTWMLIAGLIAWLLGAFVLWFWGQRLANTYGLDGDSILEIPVVGQAYLLWLLWKIEGAFFSAYTIAYLVWVAATFVLGALLPH